MTDKEFLEQLEQHPELKNRFKEILSISSNSGKELITLADEAEMQVIEQMRQLGKETLQNWANKEIMRIALNVKRQVPGAKKHVKKTLVAHHLRRNNSFGAELLPPARRYITPIQIIQWYQYEGILNAVAASYD